MKFIIDMMHHRTYIPILLGFLLSLIAPFQVMSQYFGQNKMRYKKLNFKVYDTPHFNVYYYLNNDSMMHWLAKESEVWYEMHQQVFQDTFLRKNPIIFYNNHPEFQQTTTTQGEIGEGTGGFTEAFKQRVVMPIAQSNHQTRHVLGHELVHAFQYRMLIEGNDSTRLENVGNLPLWMVEGMAEYFSIGKKDAFTSMWMRDAYARNDFPSLKQMTEQSHRYFPYRYGQSFLAFIGATYGDTVIMPMFIESAKYGYETGMKRVFGYDAQTISTLWKNSMEDTYRKLGKDTTTRPIGTPLITRANAGRMNVSPAISPDGKYVAFLSELDLFGIDLFLADAKTGQVLKKLGSRQTNKDIDAFSFIESAGAFSPDSRRFAFSVFNQGKNKLMIVDVEKRRQIDLVEMEGIAQFANITWSPDGDVVAFSGLKNGQSDLYTYRFSTKQLVQLTDDYFSDVQPSFSRDGRYIVFSTDRVALQSDNRSVDIPMSLAIFDLRENTLRNIDVFPGANNLNPHFSADGTSVYFLSNNDGFRNMYRFQLASEQVERLTDFFTGISGITEYSPAMSISAQDEIVYSFFKDNHYSVYRAAAADFEPVQVDPNVVDFKAAMLFPDEDRGVDVINYNLRNFNAYRRIDSTDISTVPYRPQFKLDYLRNTGMGMAVGNRYGAGMAGGVFGTFSDILGYNQILGALNINGEIYDFGGQVAYINQQSRWNWGFSASQIPFRYGFTEFNVQDLGMGDELVENTYLMRQFQTQLEGFVAYPFNRNHRFEVGAAYARYGFRAEHWRFGRSTGATDRRAMSAEDAQRLGLGNLESFAMPQVTAGFIGDNAVFGIAAPLQGYRYRMTVGQSFGEYNFQVYNFDYRRYERIKPLTLAARVYSYMRVGEGEDRFQGLYIGYPFLMRGYERIQDLSGRVTFNDLVGSRMAVANFEVRLPFTGPEGLAMFKSGILWSDLNLFFDAGLAWSRGNTVQWSKNDSNRILVSNPNGDSVYEYDPQVRAPLYSVGVSMRVNLFGAMILEPYYAVPLLRSRSQFGHFGLNFAPGW
ncbi:MULTISPECIES: basic secretory protein-like protein [Sphingobacterium]|uniref:Basic secretory protein-like protein n=1 Tax=Sphingobacterium populi TaxID=1812824 RepID=A0ABW5UEM7_9SPHI|nr:basic secretory protein-like protein [Sphingobacterium sp. CFCC 11742]